MAVAMPSWMERGVASQVKWCWAPACRRSSRPASESGRAAWWWGTAGDCCTSPASPAWRGSQSRLHHHLVHRTRQVDVRGLERMSSPDWMALSGIPGFSQISVKQRTLQFLISRWKLTRAQRSSSLLSNILHTAYWLAGCLAEKIHVAGTEAGIQSLHVHLCVSCYVEGDA